jgi:hypothetical protein
MEEGFMRCMENYVNTSWLTLQSDQCLKLRMHFYVILYHHNQFK